MVVRMVDDTTTTTKCSRHMYPDSWYIPVEIIVFISLGCFSTAHVSDSWLIPVGIQNCDVKTSCCVVIYFGRNSKWPYGDIFRAQFQVAL